jgi:hypothetical protein
LESAQTPEVFRTEVLQKALKVADGFVAPKLDSPSFGIAQDFGLDRGDLIGRDGLQLKKAIEGDGHAFSFMASLNDNLEFGHSAPSAKPKGFARKTLAEGRRP